MTRTWMRVLGATAVLAFSMALPAAEPVTIDIGKFAFAPKEITVAPGTTVVWINHDETPHTIADSDHAFVSKALDTEDSYAHTFDHEGDVAYFCTVHPFMVGTVHVRN